MSGGRGKKEQWYQEWENDTHEEVKGKFVWEEETRKI